jgi:hypothetical protein
MAKTIWREWTKAHEKELRQHSRAKTPVAKISKAMKRTEGRAAAEGAVAWNTDRPSPLIGSTRENDQPVGICREVNSAAIRRAIPRPREAQRELEQSFSPAGGRTPRALAA